MDKKIDLFVLRRPILVEQEKTIEGAWFFQPLGKNRFTRFLQKITFAFLRKTQALHDVSYTLNEVIHEEVQVDLDRLEAELYEMTYSIESIYRRECDRIVVGMDVFRRIAKSSTSELPPLSFEFPPSYESTSYYRGQQLRLNGIRVQVIPWIDGIFVIPKE